MRLVRQLFYIDLNKALWIISLVVALALNLTAIGVTSLGVFGNSVDVFFGHFLPDPLANTMDVLAAYAFVAGLARLALYVLMQMYFTASMLLCAWKLVSKDRP